MKTYLTGTHKGDFEDLHPTGRQFKVNGMTEFSFRNGKIRALESCGYDFIGGTVKTLVISFSNTYT